jgi:hypothetical protein
MRCQHYDQDGRRCATEATHRMYSPDGPVPGGLYCLPHGQACIDEYAEKLGERWHLRPVDGDGVETGAPAVFALTEGGRDEAP